MKKTSYTKQKEVRQFVRNLMALPNLPSTHISPAFDKLLQRCPQTGAADDLQKLLRYIQRNWIKSEKRPPSAWSTFRRTVRTEFAVTAWHRPLHRYISIAYEQLNLYFLIDFLQEQTKYLSLYVRLVAQRNYSTESRKSDKSKTVVLKKLWDQYVARTLTTSAFLESCPHFNDFNEEW